MSLAVLRSRALSGIDAPAVSVEVHLANGLPSFTIVGLPDTEVKESKDRVRAAIQNSRFEFPARRITVNLAPADLPKNLAGSILQSRWGSSLQAGRFRTRIWMRMSLRVSCRCPAICGRFAVRWRWRMRYRATPSSPMATHRLPAPSCCPPRTPLKPHS